MTEFTQNAKGQSMKAALAALLILATSVTFADDPQQRTADKPVATADAPPAHIAALLAAADKARADSIAGFEKRIAEDGAKIRTLKTTAAKREAAKKVAFLKDQLKKLKASDEWTAPRLRLPPKVGDAGEFSNATVFQVIDADESIIELVWTLPGATTSRADYATELVWVRGVATKTFADGRDAAFPGVYLVSGTKSYQATNGAKKTVLLLEPVDQAEIDKWREAHNRRMDQ